MQKIVEETNNYQQQNAAPNVEKAAAWYNTNVEELYIFFATAVLMRLNQKNRIKDYWSTDKLITTPIFGELFTRNRYLSILRYLHFADNNTEEEGKLRKIQSIVENLRKKIEKNSNSMGELVHWWKPDAIERLPQFQTIRSVERTPFWREALHVMWLLYEIRSELSFTLEQKQISTITLRLGYQIQ